LEVLHPQLAKRHPDYEAINRITRVREEMAGAGFRPRMYAPVANAILGRLKDRERASALSHMGCARPKFMLSRKLNRKPRKL